MQSLALALALAATGCASASTTGPSITDWITSALTFVLALVGGTQAFIYWKQKGVMEDALKATRDSNDVAKESAQAASKSADAATLAAYATQSLERPWLIVEPGEVPNQVIEPSSSSPAVLEIPYIVSNLGRSPAWIVDDLVAAVRVPWPAVPEDKETPSLAVSNGLRAIPLAPRERRAADRPAKVELHDVPRRHVLDGKAAILLYGEIKYRDVFGDIRTHGFAWVYTRIDGSIPTHDREWPKVWDEDAESWLWKVHQGPQVYLQTST